MLVKECARHPATPLAGTKPGSVNEWVVRPVRFGARLQGMTTRTDNVDVEADDGERLAYTSSCLRRTEKNKNKKVCVHQSAHMRYTGRSPTRP
jgi:hypothetical protein